MATRRAKTPSPRKTKLSKTRKAMIDIPKNEFMVKIFKCYF